MRGGMSARTEFALLLAVWLLGAVALIGITFG